MKQLIKNRLSCVLLVLLAIAYLFFLTLDLFFDGLGSVSALMKYLSILLCLSIAVFLHRGAWNKRDSILLISALFLTCVADLFLLLLNRPVPGLFAFCIVHLIYIRRYRPTAFPPAAAILILAIAGCLTAECLIGGFPIKYILSCLYGVLLLTATIFGFTAPLPRTNRRWVKAGMALFVLCDIHVALFNILAASNSYYPFASFFIWFFYLPAQVALALSGHHYEESCTSEIVVRPDLQEQKQGGRS